MYYMDRKIRVTPCVHLYINTRIYLYYYLMLCVLIFCLFVCFIKLLLLPMCPTFIRFIYFIYYHQMNELTNQLTSRNFIFF